MTEIRESRVIQRQQSYQLQRVRTAQGQRFLMKVATPDYCDAEEAALSQEFALFSQVRSPRSLTPVRLGRLANKVAAYYEDVEGVPLSRDAPAARHDWADVALVARQLCKTLGAFHQHDVLLCGLAPDSFLWDRHNGELRLTDAAFARHVNLPSDRLDARWFRSPCLSYAAPEVVSAVGHLCDQRADLYTLGALLYHLVCGRAPFDTADSAALIQCHLAKSPAEPSLVNPEIPSSFTALLLRLLAKSPADRYSTVEEVEHALSDALAASPRSSSSGSMAPAPSSSANLTFSNELYGRAEVLHSLRLEIQRRRSAPLMIFIEGDAGIGKTSLLQELQKTTGRDLLVAGRFSQGGGARPLSGWAAALRELANVLLTRQPRELETWRTRIVKTLGEGLTLLTELVPEWGTLLLGSRRSSAVTLDTNLNRISVAIRSLLSCYAAMGQPVVLLLDDLQLADSSSLRILELVLGLPEPLDLLVIGATRPHRANAEVDGASKLRDNLRVAGVAARALVLDPWTEGELMAFFKDSFVLPLQHSGELMDLVLTRTRGNPLFVRELMTLLAQRETFTPDAAGASWLWRRQTVRQLPLADDVVSLLSEKLQGFASEIKQGLAVAACLGSEFSVGDFAQAVGAQPLDALTLLRTCEREGLLALRPWDRDSATDLSDGGRDPQQAQFEFVHDRVLEACRALLTLTERERLHLQIARALADGWTRSSEQHAYGLARHFNEARHLIVDEAERLAVAALNLRVGKWSKRRGAVSQALEYLLGGIALLTAGSTSRALSYTEVDAATWQQHFELTKSLHEEAAEAALLQGKQDLLHLICDALLLRVSSPHEQVKTYAIRIRGLNSEKKFSLAVDGALEILERLGVRFPKRPGPLHALAGFLKTKRALLAQPLTRLTDLPRMLDPTACAVAQIIQTVYPAAYLGRPSIFPLLVYRHVRDSLRYGNDAYSAVTYNAFAIVLAGMGDFQTALRLGEVSLALLQRLVHGSGEHLEELRLKGQVFMGHYTFVFPWSRPLRDSLAPMDEGVQAALEHGDFEFASYLMTVQALAKLHSGERMGELSKDFEWRRAKVASLGHERSTLLQDLLCQIVHDLQSGFPAASCLSGPFYFESTMLHRCKEPPDHNLVFHHYLAKLMVCLFLGNVELGLQAAREGREHAQVGAFGLYLGALFSFYDCFLELSSTAVLRMGTRLWRRVNRTLRKLKRWSVAAPMNFANKLHLLEGERRRALGHFERAASHFERSIELAQEHGLIHECALAQERAARLFLERSMPRLARQYLKESYLSYTRWGAGAAARRLESQHPQHFALIIAAGAQESGGRTPLSESLDYRALLKASQAISSELQQPKVLERLLRAVFEHAGAQRGLLVLERQGNLVVEAEANVDSDSLCLLGEQLVDDSELLASSIVHYTARTEKPVVVADASREALFQHDSYVRSRQPKSVMCTPVLYQGKLLGLVYLENNRMTHVFTEERLEIVNLLASQVAISISNARFHALQMEAQQAKINPHFLFNALSSIAEVAVADGKKAEGAIVRLSQLYRYVLTSSVEQVVTLEQELQIVRSYLELEKLRFDAKLDFAIACDGDAAQVRLPGLLVQPLVENSIRHGIAPKLSPGRVSINATVGAKTCCIKVQDDGDGAKPVSGGMGFGLRSVQERLALAYGRHYSLAIMQGPGYSVEIEIPLDVGGRLPAA